MKETYIQYGVDEHLATKLTDLGLGKSTFEKTSNKNLIDKYGLEKQEIQRIKSLIARKPIEEDIVQLLLENSNFKCCVCAGTKSDSYVIHHIDHYSKSQDNSYDNLAVLCLNDHDLAHKEGISLTLKLTAEQIRNAKKSWEKLVLEERVFNASVTGDIYEVDYLNFPRVLELHREIFKKIPKTQYSQQLLDKNLIDEESNLNYSAITKIAGNIGTPLIFFGPFGSSMLREHYFIIFKALLQKLEFIDLDTLLNQKSIKAGISGKYCFYVGGIYSSKVSSPIEVDSPLIRFHLKRKPFSVQWLVDQQYFTSNSARYRAGDRNTYIMYGKIMNVFTKDIDNIKTIMVDIRPYMFGLPKEIKHRRPAIGYQKEFEAAFKNENFGDQSILIDEHGERSEISEEDLPF